MKAVVENVRNNRFNPNNETNEPRAMDDLAVSHLFSVCLLERI